MLPESDVGSKLLLGTPHLEFAPHLTLLNSVIF